MSLSKTGNITKDILAIDFGTVNTYMAHCSASECVPQGIHFSTNKPGISTAVLEREGKSVIVGDIAIEEFSEATLDEKKKYRIYTQFKPEISNSEKARKLAEKYLSTILSDSEKKHLNISPLDKQVICGIPANFNKENNEYCKYFSEIAKNAGYGEIKLIEEPVGALLYHVALGSISAIDAQKGILVIDFGGGTCDFSVMNRGNIQRSWGDSKLGGRLFDDLFYQWFLDENPKMLKMLEKENRSLFTLMVDCRNIKEKFSEIVSLDKDAIVHKTISNYGHLDNMSIKNFVERAKNYTISETFRNFFSEMELDYSIGENINLIEWFEKILISGFGNDIENKAFEEINYVILAGGSSLWFFVPEIVEKYFPKAKIIRSNNPYATVSEGLSMIPALKKRNREVREVLIKEMPLLWNGNNSKQSLKDKIQLIINNYLENLADKVVIEVFDNIVIPEIIKFRNEGGIIDDLKKNLDTQLIGIDEKIEKISTEELKNLSIDLEAELRFFVSEWFKKNKICLSDNQIFQKELSVKIYGNPVSSFETLYSVINSLLAGIAGFSLVVLCNNPIAMIVGFIFAFFGVWLGSDKLEKVIEKRISLPSVILKRIFSDSRIGRMKQKWKKEMTKELEVKAKDFISISNEMVLKCIENEIYALNEINTL